MSAFVVDQTHIDLIISTAVHGPRGRSPRYPGESWNPPYTEELLPGTGGPLRPQDAPRAAVVLLGECIASVAYRYSEPLDSPHLPGPRPLPDPAGYRWTDFAVGLPAIEALKAIDCYEYQSCEHPGWKDSGSRAFCERLRSALVGTIAGYEEAPWEWTTALARERGLVVGGGPRLEGGRG